MTNAEKAQIREAIECFMAKRNDWEGGMRILCKLAGVRLALFNLLDDKDAKVVVVNVQDALKGTLKMPEK